MITFGRKAAEENPASTAALSWVAISQSQRRALRHSAGAPMRQARSAVELKRKIREEVMNGTFSKRVAGGILMVTLAVAVPGFSATRATKTRDAERVVELSRSVDRAKVEALQRWVSAGHEEWCKDARLVAMDELKRVTPAFAGGLGDLEALPLDEESAEAGQAVFVWSSPDGRATYRVTVERFGWLLPIAGDANSIVWVPTHAEVFNHQ